MEKETIDVVIRAWKDEGKNPRYHSVMKADLRKKWPALALALENLSTGCPE